jgi:hypothetical protein
VEYRGIGYDGERLILYESGLALYQVMDGVIAILVYLTLRDFSTLSTIVQSRSASINLSIPANRTRENAGCFS